MKVVHVVLRFDAPGGVETTTREVTRRLRAAGDEVAVYASDLYNESRWEQRAVWPATVDGVPVRRFPVRKRLVPGLTLPMMVGLIDGLAASGADVLHAHSHRYGHILQSAAVADRRGIPLVVSTHYHPADRREPGWKRAMLRLQDVGFGMTAYRIAHTLVVETQREADLVAEFAPRDRIAVIPPGIDLVPWLAREPEATVPDELPADYFLFVGRLAPNKGLPYLVESLARLPSAERRPLVLMGRDWGELAGLTELARRRGVGDLLRPLGHVEDERTYRAIVRRAHALVLPSEWEAFGLVLLEAMAARVPIVATAVGGVPEVLAGGRTGRLVPYGDPGAIAEAMRAVDTDAATTRRLVAAGAERVLEYDWSIATERHRALYRAIVDGRAAGRSSRISSAPT
ncbi:MAG TPA: glycosyltransferase family 4 protein [Thermoplasmata archaeon]|nr:glycosyltransferase family 4 protein [Thermoplasmata archaeon]